MNSDHWFFKLVRLAFLGLLVVAVIIAVTLSLFFTVLVLLPILLMGLGVLWWNRRSWSKGPSPTEEIIEGEWKRIESDPDPQKSRSSSYFPDN